MPRREAVMSLLLGIVLTGSAYAATSVRKVEHGVYFLTHSSSLSSNAAGSIGLEKVLDKAAALCHLEGFHSFIAVTENVAEQWNASLGTNTGSQTARVECYSEDQAPEGAYAAEPLLLPKAIKQLQAALEADSKRAARRARKRAKIPPGLGGS